MKALIRNYFIIVLLITALFSSCDSLEYKEIKGLEYTIVSKDDKGIRGFTLSAYSDSLNISYILNDLEKSYTERIKISKTERKAIVNTILYHIDPSNLRATKKVDDVDKEIIFQVKTPDLYSDISPDLDKLKLISTDEIVTKYSYLENSLEVSYEYNQLINNLKKNHKTEFKDW